MKRTHTILLFSVLVFLLTARGDNAPSFTIRLEPTSLTLTQGESGTTTLTLTPQNGFIDKVSLSLDKPLAGVSLSPTSLWVRNSEETQDLTISTTWDTPVGRHTLTLRATSGSIQKTARLTLTIKRAPTFTVNTTADTIDARPGDGTCADASRKCSLRAAIMEANDLATPAVINIPAGTYKLTRTSSVDEQGGDLDIKSNVILKGAGANKTFLDGNMADRVLEIYEGKMVRVEGVKIKNGKADQGGGIYNDGTLTLTNSTVSENKADFFGVGFGGGIYNDYGGNLTITGSTASENTARYGGGIYNDGTLTLTNSTVSENAAYYDGGGIYNGDTLTLMNSTVSGNKANKGGGIYNNNRTLTLTNSTVSGNKANKGGGIYVLGSYSTVNLSFSTLTGNQATGTDSAGGGIYIESGTVKLKGVILGGNTSESGPECNGSLTSQGYNLIKSNKDCGFTVQATDTIGKDPALDPLAAAGGLTKTHQPRPGSPVLDKVPTRDCTDLGGNALSTDQRGVRRPQGRACDIGSVERK